MVKRMTFLFLLLPFSAVLSYAETVGLLGPGDVVLRSSERTDYSGASVTVADNAALLSYELVRANYADYGKNVKRDWSYLEAFFRNLLLGEKNEWMSHSTF